MLDDFFCCKDSGNVFYFVTVLVRPIEITGMVEIPAVFRQFFPGLSNYSKIAKIPAKLIEIIIFQKFLLLFLTK
jgi:hypothetical protein